MCAIPLGAGAVYSRADSLNLSIASLSSDFERGFIRAEVVNYKDLVENGSMNAAKEKGLVRSEGKEYVVEDGDVVLFKFNV